MTDFIIHTIDSAPEAGKPLLEASYKKNGRVPGLHGTMADAPPLLAAYQVAHEQFLATSLTDEEKLWFGKPSMLSRIATTACLRTQVSPK